MAVPHNNPQKTSPSISRQMLKPALLHTAFTAHSHNSTKTGHVQKLQFLYAKLTPFFQSFLTWTSEECNHVPLQVTSITRHHLLKKNALANIVKIEFCVFAHFCC